MCARLSSPWARATSTPRRMGRGRAAGHSTSASRSRPVRSRVDRCRHGLLSGSIEVSAVGSRHPVGVLLLQCRDLPPAGRPSIERRGSRLGRVRRHGRRRPRWGMGGMIAVSRERSCASEGTTNECTRTGARTSTSRSGRRAGMPLVWVEHPTHGCTTCCTRRPPPSMPRPPRATAVESNKASCEATRRSSATSSRGPTDHRRAPAGERRDRDLQPIPDAPGGPLVHPGPDRSGLRDHRRRRRFHRRHPTRRRGRGRRAHSLCVPGERRRRGRSQPRCGPEPRLLHRGHG